MIPLSRLIQDNDGHWYVILVNQERDFWDWVQACETNRLGTWKGGSYEDCRVDGPHAVYFADWAHK